MSDYWRETFSYFGLLRKTGKVKKVFSPEYFSFGEDRECRKMKAPEPEWIISMLREWNGEEK